jgi:formylmethanofuran dehydrogenase subunit E
MPCSISQEKIDQTIQFHGHFCPGLAIGIRAAELALHELDNPPDYEMVTVAETDMCGCDAIQFLTGCTFGKGNFIHRDLGKMAFSFWDRRTGKGFRALLKPDSRGPIDEEYGPLSEKVGDGKATQAEVDRLEALRTELKLRMLDIDLADMFTVTELRNGPPRRAHILKSLVCAHCGETVMESRTRQMGGETLCIPCFEMVEQKI